jgi:hypothetical protein
MNAASNVAGTLAEHNLKSMKLSSNGTRRALEYVAQLVGAKTAREVIELSGAHCRGQLNVLGCHTGNLIALVYKIPSDVAQPFRARPVVASCDPLPVDAKSADAIIWSQQ